MCSARKNPVWTPLAAQALVATRDERWTDARAAVQRIADQFGANVIPDLLLAWIDTTLTHTGIVPQRDRTFRLAFVEAATGRVSTAEDMGPAQRWAGRLLAARVADDETQFRVLLNSVSSAAQWSAHVAAVLNLCGTTLRRARNHQEDRNG
ncbi:hypothetical protein GCM10012275_53430 [Longimycelium tulufanense]|uniref:Uncharacterized protein n=1 Tax=Longimycelium tulufanense TaxID=907463 RepID=A0A8J3CJH1_9PSEU|nr:hypothetical protein [Longimycelium tulufanense]GGM76040.1 hypothetical protein GCM10012275_53430 [Longimycelium tulufanense]